MTTSALNKLYSCSSIATIAAGGRTGTTRTASLGAGSVASATTAARRRLAASSRRHASMFCGWNTFPTGSRSQLAQQQRVIRQRHFNQSSKRNKNNSTPQGNKETGPTKGSSRSDPLPPLPNKKKPSSSSPAQAKRQYLKSISKEEKSNEREANTSPETVKIRLFGLI